MNDTMTINVNCPFCGKKYSVEAPADGVILWQMGELIQRAMPNVSPSVRESLMTGICPECWDATLNNY